MAGTGFGDDGVERYVVRLARDILKLLHGKSNAYEARSFGKLFQRAVVVAASVAEARAAFVEAEERHDDNVGLDLWGKLGRREGAEARFVQRRALFPQAQL